MGQITATRNLVAIKVVRHAGQLRALLSDGILYKIFSCRFISKWTIMLKIAHILSIMHGKV